VSPSILTEGKYSFRHFNCVWCNDIAR